MNTELLKILYSNIFSLLGIEHLPDERKKQILDNFIAILEQRIFFKITDQLKEAEKSELANILTDESVSDEKKFAFIHNHISNFPEFVECEIALFKKELKESIDSEIVEDIIMAQ